MPDDFDLSRFLPYKLAVLSERVSARLAVEYGARHDLSVAEWRVLVHLRRGGDISVRDIHDRVNLGKPRVSRAVASLEGRGLVSKRAGHGDARLVEIALTKAGHAVLDDIIPVAREIEGDLVNMISSDEMQVFWEVMEKIHTRLDADPKAMARAQINGDG